MTVYRQLTQRLRWSLGPGRGERVSERPRAKSKKGIAGPFLDSDDEPTLIEITDEDVAAGVDVPFLLRIGALAELPEQPAKRSARNVAPASDGGGGDGESRE